MTCFKLLQFLAWSRQKRLLLEEFNKSRAIEVYLPDPFKSHDFVKCILESLQWQYLVCQD